MMSPKAKAWAAALFTTIAGVVGQVVALGILTGNAQKVAEVVAAAVTALGTTFSVYQVPNGPAPQPAPPPAP